MNITHTLPQTTSRTRRTALGLVFASIALSGTLTACGSEAENTTCDELNGKSTSEVIDLFKDAAEDEGGDAGEQLDEALKSLEGVPGAEDQFAETLKSQCDGEDGDAKLKDVLS